MTTTIWHNPRCSKSRATLELLEDRGVKPEVVKYLETPPDAVTLDKVLTMLNMEPRDLMRKSETEYQDLGLDNSDLSRDQLIAAMVANPKLIERPVVVHDGKAAIGRPPESVLNLFM